MPRTTPLFVTLLLAVACGAPAEITAPADPTRAALYEPSLLPPTSGTTLEDAEAGEDDGQGALLAPRLSDLSGFYFVLDHDGPWIVLRDSVEPELAAAPAVPIVPRQLDDVMAAWAPLERGAWSVRERATANVEVVLYGADTARCFGVAGEPALLYRDRLSDSTDADAVLDFAARAGEEPPYSTVVAARVRVQGGDCEGALWARPSTMPPPRLFAPSGDAIDVAAAPWADPPLRSARRLPDYAAVQRQYETYTASPPISNAPRPSRWDDMEDASRWAQRYVDVDSGESLVAVELTVAEGCGGFDANLFAAFRDVDGRPVDAPAVASRAAWGDKVVLDVDDDGVLEVLTSDALHVATPAGPVVFALSEPYFVCGC